MGPGTSNVFEIKKQARLVLRAKRSELTKLNLPAVLLKILYYAGAFYLASRISDLYSTEQITKLMNSGNLLNFNLRENILLMGFQLFSAMLVVGIQYSSLDYLNMQLDNKRVNLTTGAFRVFSKDFFLPVIAMWAIANFFVQTGLNFYFIPGIFFMIAFSQQYFIYKDVHDSGQKIGIFSTMSGSYRLLRNRKIEYLILVFSFLGWDVLNFFTCGLLSFWLLPYKNLTYAIYYRDLLAHQKRAI
ncbi:DUF975 family protein [Lactobacillus sp. YT155]|uniref:DUF975 family protein n=1 Tax=Lactobacillus sp. YT155 TaxID=3060955 RepID=UPI00265ECB3E|nr:DUF975 family protein [Lactobacillus sp. YT155]MDO1605718.1 DUF975 family protein [Lactobacillus sp. YT155]